MPSARLASDERNRMLLSQFPVMLGPLKVSPNAISTWCSLIGVLGSSAMPLSHAVPTSVPQTPNRL